MNQPTYHNTFLDVLLQIRHNNFEVFESGFTICEVQDVGASILMEDGTEYLAHMVEDSITWQLEEVQHGDQEN